MKADWRLLQNLQTYQICLHLDTMVSPKATTSLEVMANRVHLYNFLLIFPNTQSPFFMLLTHKKRQFCKDVDNLQFSIFTKETLTCS